MPEEETNKYYRRLEDICLVLGLLCWIFVLTSDGLKEFASAIGETIFFIIYVSILRKKKRRKV